MLKSPWFLLLSIFFGFSSAAFAVSDSVILNPNNSNQITSGYNLVNIMHMVSNAPANYTGTCPAGSAFSGGEFVGGTTNGYYTYNCAYLNVPANSTLASQIAAMSSGFTSCPEDPSNTNLQCTTKFNAFPITILQTNSCAGVYCETSVSFGDKDNGYSQAFAPVNGSPTITQLSSNGTAGNGWDLRWPSQNSSDDGYHVLTVSAYVFPNTSYQLYIVNYRIGGWRTHCPVYTSGPNTGSYNGFTISFDASDVGKTCMFECAGAVGGTDPDFYQPAVSKSCY